jgi:hypothetical protein
MSFKDNLKRDTLNCFLKPDEFAEAIQYTPKNGSPKTIKAVINRKRLNPGGEESGRTLQNQIEIFIANDSTYGVASINKGGDEVLFPEVIGGIDVNFVVVDILGEDQGMWHFLVQK